MMGAGVNRPFQNKTGLFKQRPRRFFAKNIFVWRAETAEGISPINRQNFAVGF